MSSMRYIGLDVHKETITMAIAEAGREDAEVLGKFPNEDGELLRRLRRAGGKKRLTICYEAGPCGYGLYRHLSNLGYECVVVAPSLVPKQAGQRIKTDRRDAKQLARFLRSGDLTLVTVPDEDTEAIRDLTRAREDAKKAERTARHQLQKYLLRHGQRWCKTLWTQEHWRWIGKQRFEREAQQRVLQDYIQAVEAASQRVARLTSDIEELTAAWERGPMVKAFQAFRGLDMVSAASIVAEVGDLSRFAKPTQLMAYLGLVPSEHSSGGSRRQGRITRTGNGHVRRLLVEAAWSYRFEPRMSKRIAQRNEGLAAGVQAIAWKAQQRLCRKMRRMIYRGKLSKVAATAVARELAGFLWAVAQESQLLAEPTAKREAA